MSTPCWPTSLRAIVESAYREANVHPSPGSMPRGGTTGGSSRNLGGSFGGCRRVALAQRQLHDDGIEPAAELVADGMERAAEPEAGAAMQGDGGEVRGVADDGDHQAEALRRAGVDQRREQHSADAFALCIGRDVDGILHRE